MTGPNFQMSQGLEVLAPKADRAYPIPCEEWALIKDKVSRLTFEPFMYQSFGSALVGASLSTVSSILLGAYDLLGNEKAGTIAWSVSIVCGFCGVVALIFAQKERGVHQERAADIRAQMELIEKRYDNKGVEPPKPEMHSPGTQVAASKSEA